jgi:hypothetical protein
MSESMVEKLINTNAAKIYVVKNEVNFKYTQFYNNQGDANSIKSKFFTIFYHTITYFKNYRISSVSKY